MTSYNSDTDIRKERNRKIISWMWRILVVGFVAIILFFLLIYNGWIGYMPPVEELKNPNDKFATVLYTADGVEMGRYYRNSGNRVYADYSEISQNVIDALIATEDSRFENHSAARQAALQSYHQQYLQPRPAETYRMDDCREARALLLEG